MSAVGLRGEFREEAFGGGWKRFEGSVLPHEEECISHILIRASTEVLHVLMDNVTQQIYEHQHILLQHL